MVPLLDRSGGRNKPGVAWTFHSGVGLQNATGGPTNAWEAMVVRSGDVALVPEPETYALMLAGLGLLALAKRPCRR